MKRSTKTEKGKAVVKEAASQPDAMETVAIQVRLGGDVHQQLKETAETAGISLNQLIHGICRGAMAHVVQGEPVIDGGKFISAKPQRGCVFFGHTGWIPEELKDKYEYEYAVNGEYPANTDKGTVWFGLDFTNRGVVRY